ncbi:cell wall hydrolase [Acinetobacter sp. 826659]|uniref:cell wall hydrolase n=1 Tax=Acinetobacter sp. 826659 TaxID=1310764 RepID=UPI00044A674E|nr:cell wall hydrolase [Acinetobacter sp. 826659]EXS35274.1 cell Wall Hydrolase family protein [Acinetobacter sp. 826659]
MSDTVIRDFLVSLGFSTDNEGARKMGDALKGVELKATLLHKTLLLLATGAVVAVAKTASELDKLYYSSQRIGASASNIRAYGDAISQMGGNAQNALQSLENVAQKMRNSPGYEGMLTGMGVATRDGNGQLRDRVEVMKDLSKTMKGMDYYQANAYASSLGIDENTLMAMRDDKFISNMEKYQKLRQDVGLTDELTKSGTEFMFQFRDITMTTKAITEVVVMTAGQALIPILKMINNFLRSAIAWFAELDPRFKAILATGLKFALLAVIFGGFIGTIAKLASVLPMLKGLLFLIKSLRLAFLASPIGIVLALAAAIAALWDDYQTWKNGGESLIDWSKWEGGIETAIARIKELAELIKNLKDRTVEFVIKAIDDPAGTAKETVAAVTEAAKTGAAAVVNATKNTVSNIKNTVNSTKTGRTLQLSQQDIDDLIKVTSTEVVASLKGEAFTKQTHGVVDTILNRVASGKWGESVRDVANARRQFTKITGPKSYKTKSGKVIKLNPYGSVQNMPLKDVNPKVRAEVLSYLERRANGQESSVGEHLNYANPYVSDKKNRDAWVDAFYEKSKKDGLVFGSGKNVHGHGTTKDLIKYKPKPFSIAILGGSSSNINDLNNFNIRNTSALDNNPHKDQVNAVNSKTSNVTIYQSHKTQMTINGANNPYETANMVKRHNENTMVQMARNAKSIVS